MGSSATITQQNSPEGNSIEFFQEPIRNENSQRVVGEYGPDWKNRFIRRNEIIHNYRTNFNFCPGSHWLRMARYENTIGTITRVTSVPSEASVAGAPLVETRCDNGRGSLRTPVRPRTKIKVRMVFLNPLLSFFTSTLKTIPYKF